MTEKNLGGRPEIVLTDEQIAQVEALAAFGHSQKIICGYLSKDKNNTKIADRTFRDLKKRDPKVAAAYGEGRIEAENRAISRLWEHIESDDNAAVSLNATKFYLEAQCDWNKKQLIETKDTTPQKRFILEADSGTAQD